MAAGLSNSLDYYPFGMIMPGRNYRDTSFRFGFNDKEHDNEVKGIGNEVDYGMRAYDPRIGRPISADRLFKQYAFLSPYQFFSNSPIWMVDRDGKEGVVYTTYRWTSNGKTVEYTNTAYDVDGKTEGAMVILYDLDNHTVETHYQPDIVVPIQKYTAVEKAEIAVDHAEQKATELGQKLDNRYYGEEGFKQLGKDATNTGLILEVAGAGVTMTGNPEIGVPLFEAGKTINLAGEGSKVWDDASNGEIKQAFVDASKIAATQAVGGALAKEASSLAPITEEGKEAVHQVIEVEVEGAAKGIEKAGEMLNDKSDDSSKPQPNNSDTGPKH